MKVSKKMQKSIQIQINSLLVWRVMINEWDRETMTVDQFNTRCEAYNAAVDALFDSLGFYVTEKIEIGA